MAMQPMTEGQQPAKKKLSLSRMSPLAQQAARAESLRKFNNYGGTSPAEQMAPAKRGGNPIKALFSALRGKK